MWELIATVAAGSLAGRAIALQSSSAPNRIDQVDILNAIRAGQAVFEWRPLAGYPGVQVMTDALRIDGVRAPVCAQTTAAACELLTSMLGKTVCPSTALIEDLIHDQASFRVVPNLYDPQQQGADIQVRDSTVREYSALLDRQIERLRSLGAPDGFVSSAGKSWILDNASVEHPGRAVNYGMIRPDGPYSSVSGRWQVWQQPGWAHDPGHWDYSQTLRLVMLEPGVSVPCHVVLRAKSLWS